MHWSIIPINDFILVKELTMEFFQFLNLDAGRETDNISLGFADIAYAWQDLIFIINPLTWFDYIWGAFGSDG